LFQTPSRKVAGWTPVAEPLPGKPACGSTHEPYIKAAYGNFKDRSPGWNRAFIIFGFHRNRPADSPNIILRPCDSIFSLIAQRFSIKKAPSKRSCVRTSHRGINQYTPAFGIVKYFFFFLFQTRRAFREAISRIRSPLRCDVLIIAADVFFASFFYFFFQERVFPTAPP
jgi:hypothetical protein